MPTGFVSISKRKDNYEYKILLVGIGLCLLSACTEVDNKLEVNRALEYCDRQVHRTLEVMHGKGGR